jgi:hypothetical protein
MTALPFKEIQAILSSISSIIANGLSADQRAEVLEKLPVKEDIQSDFNEFGIYDALFNYYKKTRSLDFIVLLTMHIRATESFYQDVGAELENLLYLIKKNNISIESNGAKAHVFVLMPFKETFFATYESIIKPVAQELGCHVKQANEIHKADIIVESIFTEIAQADFLIADASGRNPNVFYEIGYAHALGKKVIIIVQDPKDIPFDISRIRFIKYALDARNLLAETLREFIRETLKETRSPAKTKP